MCGCVRDHVRTCDHVCTEKGEEMMESKSVFVFVCVCVCSLCVGWGEKRPCLQQQKADSPRTLSVESMAQTSPASRCLQFDRGPKTDIHPYSLRAL